MNKKGFTLIELLVVIAIIGVLSAIVLAALDSARNKGGDAGTKSSLDNMRAQAELYYDSQVPSNTFFGTCTSNGLGGIAGMVASAKSSSGATTINTAFGTAGSAGTVTCHDSTAGTAASGTGWAAEGPLKQGGFWCIDSTGTSTSHATGHIQASAVVCQAG